MNMIESYLSFLHEGYKQSTIKRGRMQKIKSTAGSLAVSIGRQKNDPLYQKMIKYKKLYKQAKMQLERKYKSKSYMMARKMASRSTN